MHIEDKEFIFTAFGVSGREEQVRGEIERFIRPLVDEIIHDTTGSLIGLKRGNLTRGASKKAGSKQTSGARKIMISAHMDAIGFVITHIDERGFLRFSEVGHQVGAYLLGRRVVFEDGDIGVIGVERLDDKKVPQKEKMFIDIGSPDRAEAERRVRVGDMCGIYAPHAVTDRIITGGWMDDRIGCFVLLEVLTQLKENHHDIYFVFSSQEEVGLRGATTTAYRIEPDVGIAVDVTISSDLPEGEPIGSSFLGRGAAIKFMDQSVIVPRRLALHLEDLAQRSGIPHQRDIIRHGGTDAHAMQLSRGGALAGGISIPTRYIHSSGEMCALDDVQACIDLICRVCEDPLDVE
jgi:endoglucanase